MIVVMAPILAPAPGAAIRDYPGAVCGFLLKGERRGFPRLSLGPVSRSVLYASTAFRAE